jgi:pimeloyl-ACP methyl ester carboxylesterase
MAQLDTGIDSEDVVSRFESQTRQVEHLQAILARNSKKIMALQDKAAGEQFQRLGPLMRQASGSSAAADFSAYSRDAWQRFVLYLDVMRERGNRFLAHEAAGLPPVLDFEYETIIDGRALLRPVNYSLLRILPPAGVAVDPQTRPFVIIDPRAGHGAGIGGMKPDSQVGVALKAGHPCYFVVFRPMPEPGQTIADVCDAEGFFLKEVARRHPGAPLPVVIGNCQGGWASMLLAASDPDAVGAVAVSGAPLSYWAGADGKNPVRYTGGLAGGVVPAILLSDLGHGLFDGSNLVSNFESLSPGNTWWKKYYNLYAQVDKEGPRFLEFERWWSGFFFMNENEIRWIVDNLFIGNKLGHGGVALRDQIIDLRKIKAPIIVFASAGDNITPPQQALNWIADLYRDSEEIKARGQRIVYMVHDSIGHLGIFVSAKVASREHGAITGTLEAIEALAPGLYEMVLEDGPDRLHIQLQPRTIADILRLDDGREDEEPFVAVARYSELGERLYELTARPLVRALVTPAAADLRRKSAPLRLQRVVFSDQNPLMKPIAGLADTVRADRRPAAVDNPFVGLERLWADNVEHGWNLFRDWRDGLNEFMFYAIYGNPWMRMIGAEGLQVRGKAVSEDLRHMPDVQAALQRIAQGGYAEAVIRMLILLAQARGSVRRSRLERSARILASAEPFADMAETARAKLIHEQTLIVDLEPEKAIAALPEMLAEAAERRAALDLVRSVAGPTLADIDPAALKMYHEFESLFGFARSEPVSNAAMPIIAGRAAE